jgi:hypothetical protein
MDRDTHQPGAKPGSILEHRQPREGFDECILHHVFGLARAREQPGHPFSDRVNVTPIEKLLGQWLAPERSLHQLAIEGPFRARRAQEREDGGVASGHLQ